MSAGRKSLQNEGFVVLVVILECSGLAFELLVIPKPARQLRVLLNPRIVLLLYFYCTTTTVLLLYYCATTLLLHYYCTTSVLLLSHYGTTVLLPYYYGTTVLVLYYYRTTAHYQRSDLVDCGRKSLQNEGFFVLVEILE